MPNNQVLHKYASLKALAASLVAGVAGFPGMLAGMFLAYLFNWLAMKGIYFINVAGSVIETNMDKKTWETVAAASWEIKDKLDAGIISLSDKERKEKSTSFRAAFRKFAVYGRVRGSQDK